MPYYEKVMRIGRRQITHIFLKCSACGQNVPEHDPSDHDCPKLIKDRKCQSCGKAINIGWKCKACVLRDYRRGKSELTSRWRKRAITKLRLRVIALLGGKCFRCNISDPDVLTVNHKVPMFWNRKRKAGISLYRDTEWRRILKDPAGVELLCANCHLKATREQHEARMFG